MTWRTHALGGISSLWLLAIIPGSNLGALAAIAAFGALLPDIDATRSKIRSLSALNIQPFEPVGAAANRTFAHRGFLHSPTALAYAAAAAVIFGALTDWALGAALWLGYASHLALDACAKSGIPGRDRRLFLVPPALRIVTGSVQEDIYFMLLALAASALLLTQLPIHAT